MLLRMHTLEEDHKTMTPKAQSILLEGILYQQFCTILYIYVVVMVEIQTEPYRYSKYLDKQCCSYMSMVN